MERNHSGDPKTGRKHRKKHTRDVSYREKHHNFRMELLRKFKTDSFLRVTSQIFAKLKSGEPVKAADLAEPCGWPWSAATCYKHLRWLGDLDVIKRLFDGKQLWYSWPTKRPEGAEYLYGLIQKAIDERYPKPEKRPRAPQRAPRYERRSRRR